MSKIPIPTDMDLQPPNTGKQRFLQVDEYGKPTWNLRYADILHFLGTILHFAYGWPIHISFLYLADNVVPFFGGPSLAIASNFLCYYAFWKDKRCLLPVVIVIDTLVIAFYSVLGVKMIAQFPAYISDGYFMARVISHTYSSTNIAFAVCLLFYLPAGALYIFAIYRGIRHKYSLFYWVESKDDKIRAFGFCVASAFVTFFAVAVIFVTLKVFEDRYAMILHEVMLQNGPRDGPK